MKQKDKGSALLVTMLVMVILSLTGLSFLFLSRTENAISDNNYRATHTLWAAKAGIYVVKDWFDKPSTGYLRPTSTNQMVLNVRPNTGPGGTDTIYKNGDINNFFDKPYYGRVLTAQADERFFGYVDAQGNGNADIDIDVDTTDANASTIRAYLKNLNKTLFGESSRVGITRIQIFSGPTYPDTDNPEDPANELYGICTIRVTAQMYDRPIYPDLFDDYSTFTSEARLLATRVVRSVLGETFPFKINNAIDAQGSAIQTGAVTVHWGSVQSQDDLDFGNVKNIGKKWYTGGPWAYTGGSLLQVDYNPAELGQGNLMLDPWIIYSAKGSLRWQGGGNVSYGGCGAAWSAPNEVTNQQAAPYTEGTTGLAGNWNCNEPYSAVSGVTLFDFAEGFPTYQEYKEFIMNNLDNPMVHYCKHVSGETFQCTGGLGQNTFDQLTKGVSGFFLFDTTDGQVPDVAGKTNLTPSISVSGGWYTGGDLDQEGRRTSSILWVNTTEFTFTGGGNPPSKPWKLPTEPFIDKNGDGDWDIGEPFINLQEYEDITDTSWISIGSWGTYDVHVNWPAEWITLWNSTMDDGTPFYQLDHDMDGIVEDGWDCPKLYDHGATCPNPNHTAAIPSTAPLPQDKYNDKDNVPVVNVGTNVYGVLRITGDLRGSGSMMIYGALLVDGEVDVTGTVDVYFNEGLKRGEFNLGEPTTITQILTDY